MPSCALALAQAPILADSDAGADDSLPQMKENARRAVWAPMSDAERMINSKLLTKVG